VIHAFDVYDQKLQQWAAAAQQAGWLQESDLEPLRGVERQQAESLFARQGERPLIVALFGGTGVGKSSLLNRLAGETVAQVGVERPTSRELTLYLHRDYQLGTLPDDLPTDEIRIAWHHDDRRRLTAWLDLPDIDSIESHHRQLVQAWLPYIDWLVYVVSPERYSDDIGWRFVQQRGAQHHWLFVMNHWDQGSEPQLEDLRQRLVAEGFQQPTVLRTSCVAGSGSDDFEQLQQLIDTAIAEHGLAVLQRHGLQVRQRELHRLAGELLAQLQRLPVESLQQTWHEQLQQGISTLANLLRRDTRLLLLPLQRQGRGWLRREKGVAEAHPPLQPRLLLEQLWGEQIERQVADLATALRLQLHQQGMPGEPMEPGLQKFIDHAESHFQRRAEPMLSEALANPAGPFRRLLQRIVAGLGWLLPLGAAGWAGVYLVLRFQQGTQQQGDFLGLDFAIHSALLIGLAWLIPWLLQRRLQPSLADVAARGIEQGCAAALTELQQQGEALLTGYSAALQQQIDQLAQLQQQQAAQLSDAPQGSGSAVRLTT